MKNSNYGFLANRWFVHSWFKGLGNPVEVIVHYLLIGRMTSLDYRNRVFMMSALVCMVTYWIELMVSHNVKLSGNYDFTKLLHYVISQSWENIIFVSKLAIALTYKWNLKWSYIPYKLGHYQWKLVTICILNRDNIIFHEIETKCPLKWS